MLPPSLTGAQTRQNVATPVTCSSSAASPIQRPSFYHDFHASGLFGYLLRPREELYGAVDHAPIRPTIERRSVSRVELDVERTAQYVTHPAEVNFEHSDSTFDYHTRSEAEKSEGEHGMARLKTAEKVSTTKARGTTRGSKTKSRKKADTGPAVTKKRALPQRNSSSERASKVHKTGSLYAGCFKGPGTLAIKAEVGADAPAAKPMGSTEHIEISSDEDDDAPLKGRVASRSRTANGNVQMETSTRKNTYRDGLRSMSVYSQLTLSGNGGFVCTPKTDLLNAKPSAPAADWSFAPLDRKTPDANAGAHDDLVPASGHVNSTPMIDSPLSDTSHCETAARLRRCEEDLTVEKTRARGLEKELARLKRENAAECERLRQEKVVQQKTSKEQLGHTLQTVARLQGEQQHKALISTAETSRLSEKLKAAMDTNQRLEAKVTQLEQDAQGLQNQRAELQGELGELHSLQKETDQLKDDCSRKQSELNTLMKELDVKKQRTDHLQVDLGAKQSEIDKLQGILDEAHKELKALQAQNTSIQKSSNAADAGSQTENTGLEAALAEERHQAGLMNSLDNLEIAAEKDHLDKIAALELTIAELQSANATLAKEAEISKDRYQHPPRPSPVPYPASPTTSYPLSPAPSQSSASFDGQIKSDNIRKTYIKVKRRYNTLRSAADDLSTTTRNMDLTSFGEFGSCLRRLKLAMDEDRESDGVEGVRGGLGQGERPKDWTAEKFGM